MKGWSAAIDRGDFDAAEKEMRRAYWLALPEFFRRPPAEADDEDEDEDEDEDAD
ncbi:MAG: hypothetical protein ACJ768_03480 [Gaiellaceae bacterium]